MECVCNQGRSRRAARIICAIAVALCAAPLLTSCGPATFGSPAPADIDVLDKVRSLDILPRQAQNMSAPRPSGGGRARAAMFEGTEISEIPDTRVERAATGNGYDLNFENTPVATVAKVVLGDILETGYVIDPRVQGTVSLISVRPVPKSDIVFVLENALRLSGVVLARDSTGYRLTPLGDAVGGGRVDSAAASAEPGFGISVVPLQYVSAQTVLKLLDPFATKPGSVRADTTRNLLLIQGTGPERQTAVETIMSFDVDLMRGQSVGIFPISNGAPEPIIAELEKIMDSGESGLSQGVVKFQAVSRLNAIMVVSRKPAMLRTAATWISRLDRADTARNSVQVYRVKYGDARQIARVLTDMFGGGSPASPDSADNQTAPGSGSYATSSAGRLSLNGNSSAARERLWAARRSLEQAPGPAVRRRLASPSRRPKLRPAAGAPDSRSIGRQRATAVARGANHGRYRQQFTVDLCRSGELPDHRSDPATDRPAAVAGGDRRHDRGSHAEQ